MSLLCFSFYSTTTLLPSFSSLKGANSIYPVASASFFSKQDSLKQTVEISSRRGHHLIRLIISNWDLFMTLDSYSVIFYYSTDKISLSKNKDPFKKVSPNEIFYKS